MAVPAEFPGCRFDVSGRHHVPEPLLGDHRHLRHCHGGVLDSQPVQIPAAQRADHPGRSQFHLQWQHRGDCVVHSRGWRGSGKYCHRRTDVLRGHLPSLAVPRPTQWPDSLPLAPVTIPPSDEYHRHTRPHCGVRGDCGPAGFVHVEPQRSELLGAAVGAGVGRLAPTLERHGRRAIQWHGDQLPAARPRQDHGTAGRLLRRDHTGRRQTLRGRRG